MRQPKWIIFWALPLLLLTPSPAMAESTADVPLRFSYTEGEDAIPPGCQSFQVIEAEEPGDVNPCHAIATSMNKLDSPKIDVLLVVPAGPTAERDLRIIRQSTQMWADGLEWMAREMGLDWLADVVEFRISTQVIDAATAGGFSEYAITDPEIVVIASNPGPGLGIGFDPQYFAEQLVDPSLGEGPCHGVQDPFNMARWHALPGFDGHHGGGSGTYVEDCDGAGGNICFSVNNAIDPATSVLDFFQLYDLTSHETGHCLSLGHVGDGAEGLWASVPTNDIMAYNQDPPGRSKCVSSLNVEAFAVWMSQYIDSNGDEVVDAADRYWANDAIGEGDGSQRPFQIQQPSNHYYASSSRLPRDCPQPDMSPVPLAEVRDFTPADVPARAYLAIDGRLDGDAVAKGLVNFHGHVAGTVPPHMLERPLPAPLVQFEDAAGDATLDFYDIEAVDAELTDDTLSITVSYADLRPDNGEGYAQYSLRVNDGVFHAFSNRDYATWNHDDDSITWTFDVAELAAGIGDTSAPGAVKTITAPYAVQAYVYHVASDGFDFAPDEGDDRMMVGPTPPVAPAPYVRLTAGEQVVDVPIRPDGTWSGNLDLAGHDRMAVVAATWLAPNRHAIDSDHIAVQVDGDATEDRNALQSADAGPGAGSGTDQALPSPGALAGILGAALVVALRRRHG